jgi:hydroxypyruvate isomerase
MAIKQSLSWDGFIRAGMTPEQLVRTAAEIGYAGIDLVEPEYWALIRDHGLTISAITGHPLAPEGLNHRDHFPAIRTQIEAALQLAEQWHIPNILCFSGNRYGVDPEPAAGIAADHLRLLAPQFEAAGVTLVMELLNSKVAGRDYQADHTAWGVQVCELVNSPRVKLLYDIFHMQIMEGDIINTIRSHHRHIGHYHTAGNPGRHEIDATQELNYPPIIRAIIETGYDGFVGHEFFPTRDPIESLAQAFRICTIA